MLPKYLKEMPLEETLPDHLISNVQAVKALVSKDKEHFSSESFSLQGQMMT